MTTTARAPAKAALHAKHPFSEWSRHATAIAPDALEAAFDLARVPSGGLVVDPFAGSARTGTFACGRGERFFGLEAHPLTTRLALAKFARPGPATELREAARELARIAVTARPGPALLDEHPLLVRSVAPAALAALVALRDHLVADAGRWREQLLVALLGALRDCASGGWPTPQPKPRAAPRRPPGLSLVARADRMADDIASAPRTPDAVLLCADARRATSWSSLMPSGADGCISSPPYLNMVSYSETVRLEVSFLRMADSWASLTALAGPALVASSPQQVTRARTRRACYRVEQLGDLQSTVERLSRRLAHERALRRRGKRYDDLLWCYVADLSDVLENLAGALALGARAALVIGDSAPYGVRVDTPELVAAIGEQVGLRSLSETVLRERGRRWPGVGARHSRRLEERLVVLERPGWEPQLPLPGLTDD